MGCSSAHYPLHNKVYNCICYWHLTVQGKIDPITCQTNHIVIGSVIHFLGSLFYQSDCLLSFLSPSINASHAFYPSLLRLHWCFFPRTMLNYFLVQNSVVYLLFVIVMVELVVKF